MQIQPCAFDGSLHIGAPKVSQVRGLDASNRDIARQQVRQALQTSLAHELGCAPSELEVTNMRGQPVQVIRNGLPLSSLHCSISHAPALALEWTCGRRCAGRGCRCHGPGVAGHGSAIS